MRAVRNTTRLSLTRAARHWSHTSSRHFGTSAPRFAASLAEAEGATSAALNPRWFSDLTDRIQKCLSLRLCDQDDQRLREQLDYLDKNWLDISAEREGFLSMERWRGLDRVPVQWGDMHGEWPPSPFPQSGTKDSDAGLICASRVNSVARRQDTLPVRASLTTAGHVNNVVYNRYAEGGRVTWIQSFGAESDAAHRQRWTNLMKPKGVGCILKSIKMDYKLPITYPDRITVLHKMSRKLEYGADSIFLEGAVLSESSKRIAARCFEEIAVYDYQAGRRAPLEDFMVDAFRAVYERQERCKAKRDSEVAQLQALVQQIEDRAASVGK
ncbi:hypothetical protein DCS_06197 [Drechmeria coniospora]|uniref:Thioesterase/thiol ester dehydrase-isomerase n=1 Tax=Drechmeria coniospora TaxID=98403 RepID=A0A151GAX0_DRECN|nr:hypothetical protein DCS_06197 [Drechmeria coniospora]KYK54240.1 hypothetical protein DCS_06197 [Drechmeria coniospora]